MESIAAAVAIVVVAGCHNGVAQDNDIDLNEGNRFETVALANAFNFMTIKALASELNFTQFGTITFVRNPFVHHLGCNS